MNKRLVKNALSAGTTWLLMVGAAFAADGTTGTTSSVTQTMQMDIPALVRISNVDDLFPTSHTGSDFTGGNSDVSQSDPVCIYSNMLTSNSDADYTVTATGNGTSSAFTLACGTGDCTGETVAYQVFWTGSVGTEEQITTPASPHTTKFKSWSNAEDCSSSTNATLRVNFPRANLMAVKYGRFTGTLQILITPDPT